MQKWVKNGPSGDILAKRPKPKIVLNSASGMALDSDSDRNFFQKEK